MAKGKSQGKRPVVKNLTITEPQTVPFFTPHRGFLTNVVENVTKKITLQLPVSFSTNKTLLYDELLQRVLFKPESVVPTVKEGEALTASCVEWKRDSDAATLFALEGMEGRERIIVCVVPSSIQVCFNTVQYADQDGSLEGIDRTKISNRRKTMSLTKQTEVLIEVVFQVHCAKVGYGMLPAVVTQMQPPPSQSTTTTTKEVEEAESVSTEEKDSAGKAENTFPFQEMVVVDVWTIDQDPLWEHLLQKKTKKSGGVYTPSDFPIPTTHTPPTDASGEKGFVYQPSRRMTQLLVRASDIKSFSLHKSVLLFLTPGGMHVLNTRPPRPAPGPFTFQLSEVHNSPPEKKKRRVAVKQVREDEEDIPLKQLFREDTNTSQEAAKIVYWRFDCHTKETGEAS